MLPLVLLAMLAIKPSIAANIGRVQPRIDADTCCPCPAPGNEGTTVTITPATVTVTQPVAAPEQATVTVDHTVTEQGNTVYITKENTPDPATQLVSQETNPVSNPPVKTVTIQGEAPQPSDEAPYETPDTDSPVTETIVPSDQEQGPKTVTVSIGPETSHDTVSVVTVTAGGQPSESPETQPDVTVTVPYNTPQETPQADTHDQVVTKTVHGGGEGETETPTVIVSLEPSIKTVSIGSNHDLTKTLKEPQYFTVTAAPGPETVSVLKSVDHYETVTRTVSASGDGGIDIEIIIININTGEQSCKKMYSGEPCSGDVPTYAPPSGPEPTAVPCPTNVSTSFATVYNTLTVTGTAGVHYNTTAGLNYAYAMPSGTGGYPLKERKPRGPLAKWW